jgi:glycosyltransferase involved in cell wall biosynthesis
MDPIERHSLPAMLDMVVLSRLRWDSVYRRPQHLMSRCARRRRVFFCEPPVIHDERGLTPWLAVSPRAPNLWVCAPQLPAGLSQLAAEQVQQRLLDRLLAEHQLRRFVVWYDSPMPLGFTRHLRPAATVYDCIDELSARAGASPLLPERERELFTRADLVFTGGESLWEAKRGQHSRVHAFPSGVDAAHFGRARAGAGPGLAAPLDQADIAAPRLGYFGVIDERMDLALLAGLADARPDWQIVMVGPVVEIDPLSLPRRANIRYLGRKHYQDLPAYIAGWDVALVPFARAPATRFISPSKIPEYLAAGKPVVSTSIHDVVEPYGNLGLVAIADDVEAQVAAIADELTRSDRDRWLADVDVVLAAYSWDATWEGMQRLIAGVVRGPSVRVGMARAHAGV